MNYLETSYPEWDLAEDLSRHVIGRFLPGEVADSFYSGERTLNEIYAHRPKRIQLELEDRGTFSYPGRLEGHRLPVYPWPSWSLSYRDPDHDLLLQMHREHEQLADIFTGIWDLITVDGLAAEGALNRLADYMRQLNQFLTRHHELEEEKLMPLLQPEGEEGERLEERIAHEHELEEDWNEYANRIMDKLEIAPRDPSEDLLTEVELVMRYLCWELWHHSALEEHGFLSVVSSADLD